MDSPYNGVPASKWKTITKQLINEHPLSPDEIVSIVLDSWKDIFATRIGDKAFLIGKHIFPKPQIMGFLLHELIPLRLERDYPDTWRREATAGDKDIICLSNDNYSIEIKTSSSPRNIYGNRSYAQQTATNKKSKSGYYLAVNFGKFKKDKVQPDVVKIRFGWLDHKDWLGQKAASGQQSRLSRDVEESKLLELYPVNNVV